METHSSEKIREGLLEGELCYCILALGVWYPCLDRDRSGWSENPMSVVVIEQGQEYAMVWARRLEYSLIDVCELLEMD